jgi:hypothetical protein
MLLAVLLVTAAAGPLASPLAGADAASGGTLRITTTGLPSPARASVAVSGPGYHRTLRVAHTVLRGLRPGRYVVTVRTVVFGNISKRIRAGAKAYPAVRHHVVRIASGQATRLSVVYSGVVNPSVEPLPRGVLGAIGDPNDPRAIVLRASASVPRIGTIFTSGPTARLPHGLISKVTGVVRQGTWHVVRIVPVPISEATPVLTFAGGLPLAPAPGSSPQVGSISAFSAARASNSCSAPSLLKFGAHLDSVELREASLGALPPQMRLTLAVRTTEWLGVAAAAVGLDCDWSLGEIGPFQGALPVGPVVIPVYATFPLTASISVEGTLNVGTVNVASTTVVHVEAGAHTAASIQEQGTNVWLTGGPSLSGTAKLSSAIGMQAGVGVAKGANVHVEADFGPELDWASGHSCDLVYNVGSLSAGVTVLGKTLNTPSFTPLHLSLWSGCDPTPPPTTTTPSTTPTTTTTPSSTPSATPPPATTPTTPPPTTTTTPSQPQPAPSISASLGGVYGCGSCHALNVQVHDFPTGTFTYACHDNSGPGGSDTVFYSHALSITDPNQGTWPGVFCYDSAPYSAYVVIDNVASNHVQY